MKNQDRRVLLTPSASRNELPLAALALAGVIRRRQDRSAAAQRQK